MQNLKLLNINRLTDLISKRPGEVKLGEKIRVLNSSHNIYEQIRDLDVKYVIFGIKEDIGVRANLGISGTKVTWKKFLLSFLNIQHNAFIKANKILVLGHLSFKAYYKNIDSLDIKDLRNITSEIDKSVSFLSQAIIKAKKIPIIIGGGHNNAYGIIKGCALALNKKINVLNIDAHTDFRPLEGRHSGNGFSYAFHEGFVKNYFAYGLHENYISEYFLEQLIANKNHIKYISYEALLGIKGQQNKEGIYNQIRKFICQRKFGLELDCDAIKNIRSSAQSPVGFETSTIRRLIHDYSTNKNVLYFHICEGMASNSPENRIGKLITYLITDFIKANQ